MTALRPEERRVPQAVLGPYSTELLEGSSVLHETVAEVEETFSTLMPDMTGGGVSGAEPMHIGPK